MSSGAERPTWCPECFHDLHGAWTCRRRTCPAYAPKYLRDQAERLKSALVEWDGETTIATVTAPGADVLPWDTRHCTIEGPHKHSGPNGCRVNEWEAAQWNKTCGKRLSGLVNHVLTRVRQAGFSPPEVLAEVLELKRGVFHAHVIMGYRASSRKGLERFLDLVDELRGEYEFGTSKTGGFDRGTPGKYTGPHAGMYASKYLRPDSAKGSFIPALILVDQVTDRDPETGRRKQTLRPVYVNPKLTQKSGVTMRFLRWSRYAFMAWGRIETPRKDLLLAYRIVNDIRDIFGSVELVPLEVSANPPPAVAMPF